MKTTKNKGFEWPIYETKRQCSKATGWSLGFLKTCQQMGAPGFRHGRVYLAELLPWLGTQTISDAAGLFDSNQQLARLRRAQAEAKERENALAEGELHTRTELEELIWENGLGVMRADYFAMLKKYRQQPTPSVAEQIVRDDLPKLFEHARAVLLSKQEEMTPE